MVLLTRKAEFSSAHHFWVKGWSEAGCLYGVLRDGRWSGREGAMGVEEEHRQTLFLS